MKKIIFVLVFVLIAVSSLEAKKPFYYGRVTFHTFYYSLAPYGEWIEIDYGIYAWRPTRIYVGWSPYLVGRWVWTPYGWYWDSYEPFGWAVYHYGRWYYDDYYGWIWIPDYEWAPAWVEWRYTDGYIGWAPLPPYASFSITIGIRFSINWYSPHYYWHFVPVKYFCGYEVHHYVVAPKYKYRIYRESKTSLDYKYEGGRILNYGIDRKFIERNGGRVIEARIEETTRIRDLTDRRNDEKDRVIIYRPDEREINRNIDVKIRRTERQTSLDLNKIQTPRERFEIRDRERNNEIGERHKRDENNFRDRSLDRNIERNDERNFERRENIDHERLRNESRENLYQRNRYENEMKQNFPQERKSNREFEFRKESNQRSLESSGFERDREERRIEFKRQNPSPNLQRDESRSRENFDGRQLERKRER
ncbi:MAG: hypothetical protein N3F03_00460 [Ignavibacteria bacterium]|nr:hypothetical protein [Ignavibacteria bacterium]